MQQIPLTSIPSQTLTVVLDGQYCTLSLYWRQERLYLDLGTAHGEVCRGAICQNRADVVQSRSRHFTGTLHFYDTAGNRPPRWDGLHNGESGRWMLIYASQGETLPDSLRY